MEALIDSLHSLTREVKIEFPSPKFAKNEIYDLDSQPEFEKTVVFHSYFLENCNTKSSNKFGEFLRFCKLLRDFQQFFFIFFKQSILEK